MRILGEAARDGKDFGVSLGALWGEKQGSVCSQLLLDSFGSLDAKPMPLRAVQPPGMEREGGGWGWGEPDTPFF